MRFIWWLRFVILELGQRTFALAEVSKLNNSRHFFLPPPAEMPRSPTKRLSTLHFRLLLTRIIRRVCAGSILSGPPPVEPLATTCRPRSRCRFANEKGRLIYTSRPLCDFSIKWPRIIRQRLLLQEIMLFRSIPTQLRSSRYPASEQTRFFLRLFSTSLSAIFRCGIALRDPPQQVVRTSRPKLRGVPVTSAPDRVRRLLTFSTHTTSDAAQVSSSNTRGCVCFQ